MPPNAMAKAMDGSIHNLGPERGSGQIKTIHRLARVKGDQAIR